MSLGMILVGWKMLKESFKRFVFYFDWKVLLVKYFVHVL